MRFTRGATVVLASLGVARVAAADTLEVGPGKTYAKPCDAIAAAQAGDVIEVDAAGDYTDDTCTWSTDALTVRGVNGRAAIALKTVGPSGMKGIFTMEPPGVSATIENFELSGASIAGDGSNGSANGAAIRHQMTNLTVRNCYLHDNQDGILAAPATNGTGTVVIEGTEFARNGAGDGYTHNVYVNEYASATITSSYSHDANAGHLYKSRALTNHVLYNRFTDENGTASYELDLPQGGTSYVIGNLVEQSPTTSNPNMLAYGEESPLNPDQHLYLVNNTFVNDATGASDTFVWLKSGTAVGYLANDLFAGGGAVSTGATPTMANDWNGTIAAAGLVGAGSYDYQLAAGSPAIDEGAAPVSAGTQSLAPVSEYVAVDSLVARSVVGAAIDIGAYEYGASPGSGAPPDGDGGSVSGDGGTTAEGDAGSSGQHDSSGCSCDLAPGDAGAERRGLPGDLAVCGVVIASTGALRRRRERGRSGRSRGR